MRSIGREDISLRKENSQTNLPGNDISQNLSILLTDDLVPQQYRCFHVFYDNLSTAGVMYHYNECTY
jgi:hypothetical protein